MALCVHPPGVSLLAWAPRDAFNTDMIWIPAIANYIINCNPQKSVAHSLLHGTWAWDSLPTLYSKNRDTFCETNSISDCQDCVSLPLLELPTGWIHCICTFCGHIAEDYLSRSYMMKDTGSIYMSVLVLLLFINRNHWYFQSNKFGQGNNWMCHIWPSLSSWSTKPKGAESSLWSTQLRSTIWISLRTSIWFGLRTSIGLTLTGRALTDVAQHWIGLGSSWQAEAISKCTLRRMKGNEWGRKGASW